MSVLRIVKMAPVFVASDSFPPSPALQRGVRVISTMLQQLSVHSTATHGCNCYEDSDRKADVDSKVSLCHL